MYLQGVSLLEDITAGGVFLGRCDQKISYKHVSDFGRLRSYGQFLIPVHALVWTASYGTIWAGDVLSLVAFRLRKLQQATRAVHNRAAALLRQAVVISETSFKHRSVQIKGNFTKLTLQLYSKCLMYYACLLFCSIYWQYSLPSIQSFKRS